MFTVYSTNCPKCKVLIKKKKKKGKVVGQDFNLVEDLVEVNKVAKEKEVTSAPFIIKDEEVLLFADANKFINELK